MTRRRRWLVGAVAAMALVATACGSGDSTESVSAADGDASAGGVNGLAELVAAAEALAALDSYTAAVELVVSPPLECALPDQNAIFAVSTGGDATSLDLVDTEVSPDAVGLADETWVRRDLLWSDQVSQAEWVSFGPDDFVIADAFETRTGVNPSGGLAQGNLGDPATIQVDMLGLATSAAASGSEDIDGVSTTKYDVTISIREMYFGDGARTAVEEFREVGSAIGEEPPSTSEPAATTTTSTTITAPSPDDLSPEDRERYDAYVVELDQIADFGDLVEAGLQYDNVDGGPENGDDEPFNTLAELAFEERFVAMWEEQFGVPRLTMWVDEEGVLRKVELQMEIPNFVASLDEEMDPNGSTSYEMTIVYGGFNEPVDAIAPAPSEVVAAADLPASDLVEPCGSGIFEEVGEAIDPPPVDTTVTTSSTSLTIPVSTTSNPSTTFPTSTTATTFPTSTAPTTTVTAPPTTVP